MGPTLEPIFPPSLWKSKIKGKWRGAGANTVKKLHFAMARILDWNPKNSLPAFLLGLAWKDPFSPCNAFP
jgi:hypothetical protein